MKRALAALLCVAVVLVICAGAASARSLVGEIDETEPGKDLEFPHALAVDSGDRLWVTDRILGGGEVHRFSAAGSWETQTGSPAWENDHMLEGITFLRSAGEVFVADANVDSLWGLDPADASSTGTELMPLGETTCCPIRIAADNSGGPFDGSLYVFSSEGEIVRVDGEGNPVEFTEGSAAGSSMLTGADTPQGAFSGPTGLSHAGVAVDPLGHLWVADTRSGDGLVHEFSPGGRYLRTIAETAPGQAMGELSAIAVDPSNGNVLVFDIASNTSHEFTSYGVFLGDTPIFGGPAIGLAVSSGGTFYAAGAGLPGDHYVAVYGPAAPAAKHALEIEVAGSGEVVGPGIACAEGSAAASCAEELPGGSTVPLEAKPAGGESFLGWTAEEGAGGSCSGTVASCEAGPLAGPTKLKAVFTPLPPPERGDGPAPAYPPARLPAGLRIRNVRQLGSKPKLMVAGTIASQAAGVVRVGAHARVAGRRVAVSRRARIVDGRWRLRLPLPWAKGRPEAKISLTAHFGGDGSVEPGFATRRFRL